MAKIKTTKKGIKKPISDKRKSLLKSAYLDGKIQQVKLSKKETAYISKAAGGWTRQEKGLKNPETGKFYTNNEAKVIKDFLKDQKIDWKTLTKQERLEIDQGILGSGNSLPVTYRFDRLEQLVKDNPDSKFIAQYETGTERAISQAALIARLNQMQQIASEQGYTFYSTYTINRTGAGEIKIKVFTKEGLKEVLKQESWQIGDFIEEDINLISSGPKEKKKKTKNEKKNRKTNV